MPRSRFDQPLPPNVLPLPETLSDAVHDAVDGYRDAKRREAAAKDDVDTARELLLGPARSVFAAAWHRHQARPVPPLRLANRHGRQLGLVITDPKQPYLSGKVRDALLDVLDRDFYRKHLAACHTYQIDDDVLREPGVANELRAAIAKSKLFDRQKQALLTPVKRWSPRHSLNGMLTDLAGQGAAELIAALEALAPLVQLRLEV